MLRTMPNIIHQRGFFFNLNYLVTHSKKLMIIDKTAAQTIYEVNAPKCITGTIKPAILNPLYVKGLITTFGTKTVRR